MKQVEEKSDMQWENMLGEAEFCRKFGLTKDSLGRLRKVGLPYHCLHSECRVYIDSEVFGWIKEKRQSNRGGLRPKEQPG